MTWFILAYMTGSYYWFWMTLRHVQRWDTTDTIVLNATLALLLGPLLLLVLLLILRFEGK